MTYTDTDIPYMLPCNLIFFFMVFHSEILHKYKNITNSGGHNPKAKHCKYTRSPMVYHFSTAFTSFTLPQISKISFYL